MGCSGKEETLASLPARASPISIAPVRTLVSILSVRCTEPCVAPHYVSSSYPSFLSNQRARHQAASFCQRDKMRRVVSIQSAPEQRRANWGFAQFDRVDKIYSVLFLRFRQWGKEYGAYRRGEFLATPRPTAVAWIQGSAGWATGNRMEGFKRVWGSVVKSGGFAPGPGFS
jgi:hypothetical protein